MSYCRWSNSDWYIFWNSSSGDTLESQVLSIWYSMDAMRDFTYPEVRRMLQEDDWSDLGVPDAGPGIESMPDSQALLTSVVSWMENVQQEYIQHGT